MFIAIGFVEGVCLVATPALIRDFSPQLGRASAMGFWTLGPVAGSLVVSLAVSTSSDTVPWQDQYIRCGLAGLAVWLVALAGLRELAPRLRDQLMVSARDRALIEARAKGIDVQAALRRPFRQVLKLDIVGSAFAIAVFLIMYYLAVGFLPVFFQTVFGFSQSTASSLGNWFWAGQAVALVVTGVVSDRLRVRKPFMLIGAIGAVITTTVFALRATQHATSYQTFAVLLTLLAVCIGITYAPWMASFTETVERRNPALTATGLAAWGMIVRLVVAVSIVVLPHVVTTATTLAQDGPRVQAAVTGTDPALTAAQNATVKAVAAQPAILAKARSLAAAYAPELATAAKLSPATKTALVADPASRTAQGQALSEISGLPLAIVAQVIAVQHAGAGASLPASPGGPCCTPTRPRCRRPPPSCGPSPPRPPPTWPSCTSTRCSRTPRSSPAWPTSRPTPRVSKRHSPNRPASGKVTSGSQPAGSWRSSRSSSSWPASGTPAGPAGSRPGTGPGSTPNWTDSSPSRRTPRTRGTRSNQLPAQPPPGNPRRAAGPPA